MLRGGGQDVLLEDILNVRSLSISLKTMTDAGGYNYFTEDANNNGSFLVRSDLKHQSNVKQHHQMRSNDSCIIYQHSNEDDSILFDH